MKDYRLLCDALKRRMAPERNSLHIGVILAREIAEALEEADEMQRKEGECREEKED